MIDSEIKRIFEEVFGYTSLGERLDDVNHQFFNLIRYRDVNNLKDSASGLLCSLIQLCNESGWSYEEMIKEKLKIIESRKQQYHSLGRKKRIAILGTSANPIHLGHIKLAQFVLNVSGKFDEVWIMPSYTSIWNKNLVSAEHRLEMCRLACKVDGRIKTFDYEIKKELSGETYKLVKELLNDPDYKDLYDFSLIIGQDNANTFDKWINYEHLEKMISFVVVPRKGVEEIKACDWYKQKPHIWLKQETDINDVSSTQVRELLKQETNFQGIKNGELKKLLNDDVIEYIKKNGLYV